MALPKHFFQKYRDLILGVITLVLGIAYTVMAQQIKQGNKLIQRNVGDYAHARIVPTLLGVLLIILSVALIFQGIRKMKTFDAGSGEGTGKTDMVPVALTFAAMILYLILLPQLGFMLATMIYLFAQMIILAPKSKRNYVLFAIVAVVFTVITFVAFRIGLTQMLPRGPIEALIGY